MGSPCGHKRQYPDHSRRWDNWNSLKRRSAAIAIIAVLLLCGTVWALSQGMWAVVGRGAPAAVSGTWYYSGDGVYQDTEPIGNGYPLGCDVTCGVAGNITKISVNMATNSGGGNIKLALYNPGRPWA